jgi:hypothetical protein
MSSGDVIGKEGCVVSDARQERRTHGVCASQTEKIETRPISHPSAMARLSGIIENGKLYPLKVETEATGPDNRGDVGISHIQFALRS